MGNQPSVPKPGTKFQVIGAGLSRTGTASFSEALRILLDGPVYHGGTQATLAPPVEIKSWIKLLSHWPPKDASEKKLVRSILAERFDGYAAATDAPVSGLVKEMLELYPDAKVICTVRDADAWVKSMATVANASTLWFLSVVLLPLPGMRHFPTYINVLRKQWVHLYGEREPMTKKSYYGQIELLKEIVSADRLLFFNVKEGWEPLCKALGKEIPDVPFPNINDGNAIDALAERMIKSGLVRWAMFLMTVVVVVVSAYLMRTSQV
ncbi:hypothetical protein BU23DRAFT_532233 [Bimuria novae-zelandiae CBS 107.79]|uniref:NAD dependent epimerase/dehydratase n=1 Tax=Bimuria novae-zelandiae CBS 107.79 TaxID=1447943 RepID=A0A6A5VBP6_9PLEO|nr:hypothetical protein BU23DRAFT_532233 [Bimuria novae-zelandiae CBS 107.79]